MLPTLMLNKPYLQGEMASPYGATTMLQAGPTQGVMPQQFMYCYTPVGVSDAAYSQLPTIQAYHHQQQQQQQQQQMAVAARSLATQMPQYQISADGRLQQLPPSYQMPMVMQQPTVTYVPADQMYMTTGKKVSVSEFETLDRPLNLY